MLFRSLPVQALLDLRVLRQLAKVEERLHGQTKFNLIARWRLADELWVLAAAGVVRAREVPAGWGLAECSPAVLRRGVRHALALGTLPVRVVVPAPRHASPDARRARILRNIAVSLTKAQFPGASAAAGPEAVAGDGGTAHDGAGTTTHPVSGELDASAPDANIERSR